MKLFVLVLLAACSDRGRTEIVDREPPHQRRVIEPPSANVRLRPPHAIHADAVGPYKLGAQLEAVVLPSGPHLLQFDIPTVIHQSVLRADDTILIGGEPRGAVGIIAIVGSDVAKTEAGIHVGSSRAELLRSLGPVLEEPDRVRDPRVLALTGMPNLRALMATDTVAAFAIRSEARDGEAPRPAEPKPAEPKPIERSGSAGPRSDAEGHRGVSIDPKAKHDPKPVPAPPTDCTRPAAKEDAFGACLIAGELVTVDGDDLIVRGADDKILATLRAPGLIYAAALRDGDRDDLVAVERIEDTQQRTWRLQVWHADGGKPVPLFDPPVSLYQLTSTNVRWIGAELPDVELYLELAGRPDSIEVGGLLTTRVGDRLRDVLAISPVSVPRKHGKLAQGEASDAGVPPEPADAHVLR